MSAVQILYGYVFQFGLSFRCQFTFLVKATVETIRPFSLGFRLNEFRFHGQELDSDHAEHDASEDPRALQPGIKLLFVQNQQARSGPHDHDTGLVDWHDLDLVIVLHGLVEQVYLQQGRESHQYDEEQHHKPVIFAGA